VTGLRLALPRPSRIAALRPRPVHLVAIVLVGVLLAGGWLWLRDSSFVKVEQVRITGVSGPDAGRIRLALANAAADMTTLHVRRDQLMTAIEPFPIVRDIEISTDFPHGLRIRVVPRDAVGALVADGRRIAVAGDGTILRGVSAGKDLASVPIAAAPGGTRLADRRGLAAVRALAAAPPALRKRVARVSEAAHGLTVTLRAGPDLYFGDDEDVVRKWAAATRVLADRTSAGATYIDVRVPQRPVAGGGAPEGQLNPAPDATAATAAAAQAAQAEQAATGVVPGNETTAPQTTTTPPPEGTAGTQPVDPQP